VAIASIQILTATTAGRLADGVFFGCIGVWLVLVESRWHGLTYGNSWPLTLVAVGASYVVKAIAGSFLPETPHVRVTIDREGRRVVKSVGGAFLPDVPDERTRADREGRQEGGRDA
jgi:hypothetical protein